MIYLNKDEILQCPNKCDARLTSRVHVSQTWFVDNLGQYEETLSECDEIVSASGEYECSNCGEYAKPVKKVL